ncbi:unnamed protein product [Notodromas monacha]|uniref:PDZ domain-containing protein n=1 Tax=Notodromas monacha TaxID=399045 RepID=A0A7R9BF15_9CRUS|nr:unnamed protein product [Notodromas monacha]CAG0914170.1 unnamed protein product [Notodromas monacha]
MSPKRNNSRNSEEFEVTLTKVHGSLGFTLRKEDDSILGHYIRALVKEPAISNGRLKPGDKIVSVNGVDISEKTHAEAVAFLRSCPEVVTLRLYRDMDQTPVSPLSPTATSVEDITDSTNKRNIGSSPSTLRRFRTFQLLHGLDSVQMDTD